LAKDPELRQTPSGTAVADLRVAVNDQYTNKAGERIEQTIYIDVVVWDRAAENCGKYLGEGSPVLIEGRLQVEEWPSKDGQPGSRLRVKGDRVQFLEFRRDRGPNGQNQRPAGPPGPRRARAPDGNRDQPDGNQPAQP